MTTKSLSPQTRARPPSPLRESWQQVMKHAVRDPIELCRLLDLPTDLADRANATGNFPLFVPHPYVARMRPGDPQDPLLRQVLPVAHESITETGESLDPVGDLSAGLSPGLIHKYEARVLMVTTGACAVHCRYCFRRHYPYAETPRSPDAWNKSLEVVARDERVSEIILSGGDPLTLIDDHLQQLAGRLADIPHLQRLRLHTRLPIVIPQRVTDRLLSWLTGTRLTPIVVVHVNHPAEIDQDVVAALARLSGAGVTLLNQAVLLRGVNDRVDTLAELCLRLVQSRVLPYYLHQLDRVAGAGHFEVPVSEGRQLMAALRAKLPGYAVPRYVQEVAGQPNKVVLA